MSDMTQSIAGINDLMTKIRSGSAGAGPSTLGLGSLIGGMSATALFVNIVAGLVGSAYFIYGKKTCNVKMLFSGLALCIVPYFIGSTILLVVACAAMAAAPFFL